MDKECTVQILPFEKLVFSTRISTGMWASLFFQFLLSKYNFLIPSSVPKLNLSVYNKKGELLKKISQKVEVFHDFLDNSSPTPHTVRSDMKLRKMWVCMHCMLQFSHEC